MKTQNLMRKLPVLALAGPCAVALLLASMSSAAAQLVIADGDILNNQYSYNLSFDDLADASILENDSFSLSNVLVRSEGTGSGERRYVSASAGATTASVVYKFDFADAGYAVESVDFSSYLFAVANSNNTYRLRAEYSTDGSSWTMLRAISTTPTSGNQSSSGWNAVVFDALDGLPDVVYYRVTFEALTGTFLNGYAQWDRTSPGANGFTANFNLVAVPEPALASVLLVGVSALVSVALLRRRNIKRS